MISQLLLSSLLVSAAPEAAPAPATLPADDDRLVAPLVVEDEEPIGKWRGSVNAGATLTRGNSEITTASVGAEASYREEKFRHTLRGWWNFAEQRNTAGDNEVTQRRIGGNYKYDYFATEKLYWNGLFGIESDSLANLDLRWYAGGGVGYQFYEKEDSAFSGELGLVYFSEEFRDGSDNSYIAARGAYNYWRQINENVRFEQIAEAFPSLEDVEDFYGRLDSKVQTKLSDSMFAQLQWVFDYDNTPAPGAQRDDHRFILGVGWTF